MTLRHRLGSAGIYCTVQREREKKLNGRQESNSNDCYTYLVRDCITTVAAQLLKVFSLLPFSYYVQMEENSRWLKIAPCFEKRPDLFFRPASPGSTDFAMNGGEREVTRTQKGKEKGEGKDDDFFPKSSRLDGLRKGRNEEDEVLFFFFSAFLPYPPPSYVVQLVTTTM